MRRIVSHLLSVAFGIFVGFSLHCDVLTFNPSEGKLTKLRKSYTPALESQVLEKSNTGRNVYFSTMGKLRQVWRDIGINVMRQAKEAGQSILDFGGATDGHLHYADVVADYNDHTAWYQQHAPHINFVPNADISKPLPFKNRSFDWIWTSHVAEHVPDPELFCREVNRISRIGGVICVPSPLADNLMSKHGNPGSLDHVWWWIPDPKDPDKLAYMRAVRVLNIEPKIQEKNNLMRTWFGTSWESCFIYRKPLRCNKIAQKMVDWSKSDNTLPLHMIGSPSAAIPLCG